MACTSNLKGAPDTVQYVSAELMAEDDGSNIVQLESGEDEYNVAYANDAGTVFVQQGQYVIPVNGHTVLLQDDQGDFEQYIINGEEGQDSEQMDEEMGQSIIYYTGEFPEQSIFEDADEALIGSSDAGRIEATTSEALIPPKQIKLEQNYVESDEGLQSCISIEDNLAQLQEDTGSEKIIIATSETNLGQIQPQYQYAILKNGKLHLQTLDVVDAPVSGQFSIVEDDSQHQQLQEQLAAFQQSINLDDASSSPTTVDLDKITGRNLITGQTVTLDSYFDKLQRRLANVDVTNQCLIFNSKKKHKSDGHGSAAANKAESNFINKKVVVGKTSSGKKIVGKILRIHSTKDSSTEKSLKQAIPRQIHSPNIAKEEERCGEVLVKTEVTEQQPSSVQPQIIIKKHVVTRENFDCSIGRTLSGLMGLETVQRKLQNKNLVVKLVEKTYDHEIDVFNKMVSYVYGHMALVNVEDENSDNQAWVFVLHNENDSSSTAGDEDDGGETVSEGNVPVSKDGPQHEESPTEDVCKGKLNSGSAKMLCTDDTEKSEDEIKDLSLEMEDSWNEFNETVSLTISITVDKNGKKSTRVNLTPQQSDNGCHTCNKEFKTPFQLRKHINNVHFCGKSAKCNLCGKNFANEAVLQRHQKIYMSESCFGRWYKCSKCPKSFNTAGSLKRHLTVHDPSLRPLECSICMQRFTDKSSLRKHLLIHTGIRAYACEVCNRMFVNQGDLNFHRRIHDPVKQFSCDVCSREFSRHSNLMRHAEIHRGAGALHRCDICGCSYSFISSLTRHIVQKHISNQQQE